MSPAVEEVETGESVVAPSHARRRRRLRIVAGVVGAGTAVAVVVFVIVWRNSGAHQVSTAAARRRFEQGSSTSLAPSTALRPAAGVYLFTGSGTEHLSLPPKSQSQGPQMPATVTHRSDGCWTFRIDYSSAHWQTWVYCPRDGGLVELGGQTFERWDFVFTKYDSTSSFTCAPASVAIRAGARPGDHWQQECRGTSTGTKGASASSGQYTYVGPETVTVAGTPVAAYHFRQVRRVTGNQTGTQTTDLWFAQRDGLPLRNRRVVDIKTDTVVGASTYTERGSFELASLEPQH